MQPADPAARKRALWVAALVVACGAALLAWLSAETARIEQLSVTSPEQAIQQATTLFLGVTWAAACVTLLAAIVILRISLEIRRSGRYPAPGARLLRDTVVRTGMQAERIARAGLLAAVLLAAAAPLLVVTGRRVVAVLAGP
jgi:hypothetical protein